MAATERMDYSEVLNWFEGDARLLEFEDELGVPWWYQTRATILEALSKEIGSSCVPNANVRSRKNDLTSLFYLANAIRFNRAKMARLTESSIGFHIDTTRYTHLEGSPKNIYSDFFVRESPVPAFVMEKAPVTWTWEKDRTRDQVYDYTPRFSFYRLLEKLKVGRKPLSYCGLMSYVVRKAKTELPCEVDDQSLSAAMSVAYENARAELRYSKWLLDNIGQSVELFVMLGSVFSRSYYITRGLKESGIRVAELQHGVFPKDHSILFCPAPFVVQQESFQRGLPNDMLLYGSEWADHVRPPVNKVIIGNPFRESILSSLSPREKDTILIVGCVHDTEKHMRFAHDIAMAQEQCRVIFRPHPTERNFARSISENYPNVPLDEEELFSSLSRSKIVIGEYSTVLYEALGISDAVAAWRTDYSRHMMPENLFCSVKTVEDVLSLLKDPSSHSVSTDKIWAIDWRKNYASYLREVGIKSNG